MLGRAIAYRVVCPLCGEFAQLRVLHRSDGDPLIAGLSCPNQTARDHGEPTLAQLEQLIPR